MNEKIKELNQKILDWWCKNKENFGYKDNKDSNEVVLQPSLIHDLSKDAEILFVGLNPGGNSKDSKKAEEFNICNDKENYIENYYQIEGQQLRENKYSQYFGIFHIIANDIFGSGFNERIEKRKKILVSNDINKIDHIDLFYCRGTQSKQVMGWIKRLRAEKHGIEVFKEVLNYLKNVKVVVFNNVNSSNIIKYSMNNPQMTDNLTYKYEIGKREVDLIFSGMITGSRRIDSHSLERLVAIIKNVLNINS